MSVGRGGGVLRKYEICIQMCNAQQDLAGNMYALENGNDLLFKEVAKTVEAKYK